MPNFPSICWHFKKSDIRCKPLASECPQLVHLANHPIRSLLLMKLEFTSLIYRPVGEVFTFCASTKGFLRHFPLPTEWISGPQVWSRSGELLEFKFKVAGLAIRYVAEITEFELNKRFVDEMRKGPYQHFKHEHIFEDLGASTRVTDRLEFSGGFGGIGDVLIAKPVTTTIFKQRHALMKQALKPD